MEEEDSASALDLSDVKYKLDGDVLNACKGQPLRWQVEVKDLTKRYAGYGVYADGKRCM